MLASAPTSSLIRMTPEAPGDAADVHALVLNAFGPGRFAKTAERLREKAALAAGYVARDGRGRLIGSVRLWSITVGDQPAVFLGPIAVAADARKGGLGADLVGACIGQAQALGVAGVLLVGDSPYFERFGFQPAPDVRMPGPVDQARVLWLPVLGAPPSGPVRAA